MTKIARYAGAAACLGTFGLWLIFLFANPYAAPDPSGSLLVPAAMLLLALVGGMAAWRARRYLMLAAGLLSFAPVGLYLLGTPGLFRWIGVLNLAWLLAALGLLVSKRIRPTPGGAG